LLATIQLHVLDTILLVFLTFLRYKNYVKMYAFAYRGDLTVPSGKQFYYGNQSNSDFY